MSDDLRKAIEFFKGTTYVVKSEDDGLTRTTTIRQSFSYFNEEGDEDCTGLALVSSWTGATDSEHVAFLFGFASGMTGG